jgi:hypothetical protein
VPRPWLELPQPPYDAKLKQLGVDRSECDVNTVGFPHTTMGSRKLTACPDGGGSARPEVSVVAALNAIVAGANGRARVLPKAI